MNASSNSSNSIPPVFILGTKSAPTHSSSTAKALQHIGIQSSTWDPLDMHNFRLQHGERIGRRLWLRAHYGNGKPPSVIAHYISHYRLMQHAISQNLQRIIVIEGGCLPDPQFKQIAQQIHALDSSFEFVTLSTRHLPEAVHRQQSKWMTPLGSHHLVPSLNATNSACAYSASIGGLRKLLPLLMPIRQDLDTTLARLPWLRSIRGFEIWPQAVFQDAYSHHMPWDTATASAAKPAPLRILSRISAAITRSYASTLLKQRPESPRLRTEAFLQHKDSQ